MRNIIYILFVVSIINSCSFRHSYVKNQELLKMSLEDLNLYVAIKYLELKQDRICNGKCSYLIHPIFMHTDSCFLSNFDHLKLKKSIYQSKVNVPLGRYDIPDFGYIRVGSYKNEKPDFIFSPIHIDKKLAQIHGAVFFRDGRRSAFTYRIYDDDIVFLYDHYYKKTRCVFDFNSY